jgi:hypothetical protein
MKKTIVFFIAGLLLVSLSVFAEDVLIDINGNLEIGSANPYGRFEVFGEGNKDAIVGFSSGSGSGVYGENTPTV